MYILYTSWDVRLCSGLGTMYGNIMLKKLKEIKLGFWDNVRKCNGKKLLEIKPEFWDIYAICKSRL